MWGCSSHWYRLPVYYRNRIWATYRVGQEDTMTPSDAYLKVVTEVEKWIKENV